MPLGTILIAGDDGEEREFLAHLLRSQGYRVLAAKDGSETMDLLRAELVDLTLLDVLMPRAGGFSVCRQVKSHPETRFVPVVLVTGMTVGTLFTLFVVPVFYSLIAARHQPSPTYEEIEQDTPLLEGAK